MQAITQLCESTAIASRTFVSTARLGNSKHLLEHFPTATRNGLLLSVTFGIVAKIVSERVFSTKNPRVTRCLTAARVSLCTLLAPQLTRYFLKHPGINLSASCLLFVLSEMCIQFVTTLVVNRASTSQQQPPKNEPPSLLQEIRRILPTIPHFEDTHSLANPWKHKRDDRCTNSRRWILWLVRTLAWQDIQEAKATANLIQDRSVQSQAFFEIVNTAVDSCKRFTLRKTDSGQVLDPVLDAIQQAQRIATAKEIAAAMQNDEWKAKAYLAIILFEAEKDIQKAQATLETVRKHLLYAEIVSAAIIEDQQTAIAYLASEEITATSFLQLFQNCISKAAKDNQQATLKSIASINNPFLQVMAKIEVHRNNAHDLYSVWRVMEQLQQDKRCSVHLKQQAFLKCVDALRQPDSEYVRERVIVWVKDNSGHEINPTFLLKIARAYAHGSHAILAYQQGLPQILANQHLDRAWFLLAIAKRMLENPWEKEKPPLNGVLEKADAELAQVNADTTIPEVRKIQATIKLLKIKLKHGLIPPTPLVPEAYQHHVSIEFIKALATAGQEAEARRMALEIPQLEPKVRALISIVKAQLKAENKRKELAEIGTKR